ncbi:hypothetical protein D3C81_2137660 [compost metagenome]
MRNVEKELYEIELIEKFRKDELYEPEIQYESGTTSTPLVADSKRKKSNADS